MTECGILNYLKDSGVNCEEMVEHRNGSNFELLKIPFSSGRKRETSVVTLPDGTIRVFVKGAPEIVVEKCKLYFAADGRPEVLSSAIQEKIENVNKEFAGKCYRNIMVAYADISRDDFERMKSETNNFKTN